MLQYSSNYLYLIKWSSAHAYHRLFEKFLALEKPSSISPECAYYAALQDSAEMIHSLSTHGYVWFPPKSQALQYAHSSLPHKDVNSLNEFGWPLLEVCAALGGMESVKAALAAGADAHCCDRNGDTALFHASFMGKNRVVKLLLSHGADPNHRNSGGFTPLCCAAQNGHAQVTSLLIENGADVNHIQEGKVYFIFIYIYIYDILRSLFFKGVSPIMLAVQSDALETVRILVSHGAKLDGLDFEVYSPLAAAVADGNVAMVDLLLSLHADVNGRTPDYDDTPLHIAVRGGHVEVTRHLLQHHADVRLRNQAGTTALDEAIEFKYQSIVKLLQDAETRIT